MSLVDNPRTHVDEAIDGLLLGAAHVTRLDGFERGVRVVLRSDWDRRGGKVALIAGGGSGHEPAHGGLVGRGLLTAAVAGDVFASPSVLAVLSAIRAVADAESAGVLLLIKNYTGDRLNFGLAAERARAEGVRVEVVVIADDCALAEDHSTGRRGVAGTVLVHKVAGAAAERGLPLEAVAAAARAAAGDVKSLGVALSVCSVPGQPRSTRLDEPDTVEVGMGIHGEAGLERVKRPPTAALVERVVTHIVNSGGAARGDEVAVLVNNLGGTTPLELGRVAGLAVESLRTHGVSVRRLLQGAFMTALDMKGFSLSVLPLDAERIALLDAPAAAAGWPSVGFADPTRPVALVPVPTERSSASSGSAPSSSSSSSFPSSSHASAGGVDGADASSSVEAAESTPVAGFLAGLERACRALLAAEGALNALDAAAGDGDCGLTFAKGATALLSRRAALSRPLPDVDACLVFAESTVAESMGGTSGILYSIFLEAARRGWRAGAAGRGSDLSSSSSSSSPDSLASSLVHAARAGLAAVQEHGGAAVGDRTMVDALVPAVEAMEAALVGGEGGGVEAVLRAGAEAAREGANRTRDLAGRRGRASYVSDRAALKSPDPGAVAVAVWLAALANVPLTDAWT